MVKGRELWRKIKNTVSMIHGQSIEYYLIYTKKIKSGGGESEGSHLNLRMFYLVSVLQPVLRPVPTGT